MPFPFALFLDKELKILHTSQDCQGVKIPAKYGYLEHVWVTSIEQAREVDLQYRPCDKCKRVVLEERQRRGPTKKSWRRGGKP